MAKKSQLASTGYQVIEDFLNPSECQQLLDNIQNYRNNNKLQEIFRPVRGRNLHYFVIRGDQIEKSLSNILQLYFGRVNQLVNDLVVDKLVPISNLTAGVNVNIIPPGDYEYRWHYDRTYITAILYLNEVQGGSTEMYPNNRIFLKNKFMVLQKLIDWVLNIPLIRFFLSNKVAIAPQVGRLAIMQANRCFHSVTPVEGVDDRINIILAYDYPNVEFPTEKRLDKYLYTRDKQKSTDPNYD